MVMNKDEKASSDIDVYATNHIKETLDPKGELSVLTDEQVEIVVDRIYERLKAKRKGKIIRTIEVDGNSLKQEKEFEA